jgi:hypothetical protein
MKYPKTLKPKRAVKTTSTKSNQGRKHLNKKFYTSYKWRKHRQSYITQLQHKQTEDALNSNLPEPYILDIVNHLPVCENCLDRFIKQFQPGLNEGTELDHIKPINPENALDTQDGKYGEPLDFNNNQLLCKRCHAEKSGRDK